LKHMRNMNLSPVKGIKVRHYVEVLSDCESDMVNLPDAGQIADWVNDALVETGGEVSEVSVKLVSAKEMADLNKEYRQRSDATNVLSFPMNVESETGHPLLGDIAVCPAVVIAEAKEQDKSLEAHFAHMLVHGVLHLQGHNHKGDEEAEKMEQIEVAILRTMGFPNPYMTPAKRHKK